MDLQQIFRESFSPEDNSFIGAVILPEVLSTPPRVVFNPNDVTGIQVWNRGLCAIVEVSVYGDWYMYLLREYGSEQNNHVMAYNAETRQWLHLGANFDYHPVGETVKRTLAKNWPPRWMKPWLKTICKN